MTGTLFTPIKLGNLQLKNIVDPSVKTIMHRV